MSVDLTHEQLEAVRAYAQGVWQMGTRMVPFNDEYVAHVAAPLLVEVARDRMASPWWRRVAADS